jgi:ATPase family protein associated with various cellular activities (AAA)/winged helix domain-containing protein
MTEVESKLSWVEANKAHLVAQFSRLKRQLGGERERYPREPVQEAGVALEAPPAIDRLCELFGLSDFEREVLLLCAGVEMDSELAAVCGAAQGHPQRTYATFGLALATLPDPHWSALTPSRPLRRFRLVELGPGHGLTSAPLRVDERILHYLAGVNLLDQRLQSSVRLSPFPEWIAEDHKLVAVRAVSLLESCSPDSPVLHLCGDDPQGQEDAAALAAHETGRHLFTLRAEDLPAANPDLDQLIPLWEREALLLPGALLIQCAPGGFTASARHLVERLPGPLILASREPVRFDRAFLRLDVDKPTPAEQKRLWEKALGAVVISFNGAVDALSEQFRLSAKTIHSTGALMGGIRDSVQPDHVWAVCRSLARPKLEDLAERIVPCASWEDLVLPELQIQALHQLASQVRHRMKVYETWGFSAKGRRGLGVSALFAGESGTGKTMAAEVLARELALDLYRIDLSAVVSKYIGETEKNLKQVFDATEEGGVLLLFDEADALFGKRSDVRDSHDRYANIEVSYLLQRMEAYQGLAILTTNLKSALDKAFQRRLRFTLNFPFPDSTQREAIWSRIFPAETPLQGLDFRKLAQLNVPGGNIRNIALNAAFLAAESGMPVQMVHVLQAARLEAQKIERAISEAEIRGWV